MAKSKAANVLQSAKQTLTIDATLEVYNPNVILKILM